MKFANRLSLVILATGLTVLMISSFTLYNFSYNTIINSQFMYTKSLADEISDDINFLLFEKVKTALTLANTPIIKNALETSNSSYANLSDEKRKESIKLLNEKWKSIKDPADSFILKFTDNKVSTFLKNQQAILKGEYGEIFLTNKFGALVASTSKLSTLAHGHKYWWLGSYDNGEGAVFFDDRGYDDSVGGYVLGLVVPIRKGTEIIGVLKCNLNILGSISELISGEKNQIVGNLKLIRSGGMVVFEEGFEPLSTQVHGSIFEKLKSKKSRTFIINDSGEKYIVGCSEIEMTKGGKGYGFGGTFESIDHKKGNTGESWYVVCSRHMSVALMPITKSIKTMILTGAVIILILVLVSYLFGRKIAKPLEMLKKATEKIGKGDFKYRIGVGGKDEFGNLAQSFNNMASKLQLTTTSLELLEDEVKQRRQLEEGLKESELKYRQIFETNMAVKLMIDPESGAIVEANEAACNYYGYSKRELETLKISDINALPPEKIHFEMQKAKSKEQFNFNFPHRLASGEIRDVEVYSGPVHLGEKTMLHSIIHDVTDRTRAEEQIKQHLKEKDVLLREIHHRVKNNMQVTIGMLKLQSDYVEDKKSLDIFIEVQNRMKSMALVHEKLYESEDLANISFKGYVNDLLKTLFTSYGVDKSRISSKVNVEDALFEVDFATPCGLIITELVSNSLKHAFPMDKDGEIIVSLNSVDDGFELIVCDDGTGFPEDISFETTKSFGLNLVKMLVEGQLEGEIKVDRSKGTQYHIGFKRPVYSDSITI